MGKTTLSQSHISGIGLDPRIILESCPQRLKGANVSQRFTMSKKIDHSHCSELHSCSAKFVYPISFVSLLICVSAMVRVELISKRVDLVENIVAEVKQTPLKRKGEDASSRSFNDLDQVVLQAERIMTGEVLMRSVRGFYLAKAHRFVNLEDFALHVNNVPFRSFTSEKS